MVRNKKSSSRRGNPRKRAQQHRRNRPVPVTVLNGFLGSGKTTMLQNLLLQAGKCTPRLRPAVIVNDMSSLDVDGIVVEETEIVSEQQGNFASISPIPRKIVNPVCCCVLKIDNRQEVVRAEN